MAKHPSSTGSVPKGKSGSGRTLDGAVGKCASGSNQSLANTSHAGGKGHKSMGGGEGKKCKDPGVKCHAQGPQGSHSGGY